jgi:hypothetical protein
MPDYSMAAHGRLHLERLKLAADVLLADRDDIPDTLEAELMLFRERVEYALPSTPNPAAGVVQS